jgi:WD40 repeat protein
MKHLILTVTFLLALVIGSSASAGYAGSGVPAEFTENGRYFLVDRGNGFFVWDIQAGTLAKKLPPVGCTELKPLKQEQLFLCGNSNELAIWDWQAGTKISSMTADMPFRDSILAYSPRTNRVVTRQGERQFALWNVEPSLQLIKSLSVEGDPRALSSAVSPDAVMLAVAQDSHIHFYNLETEQKRTMTVEGGKPRELLFSFDGQLLAASIGNTIVIVDVPRLTIKSRPTLSPAERARGSVAPRLFSKDGRRLVAENYNWSFPVYDVETGNLLALTEFTYVDKDKGARLYTQLYASAISPDGNILIAQPEYPYTLQRWDLRAGKALPDLCGDPCKQMGPSAVGLLKFSPDASRAVIGLNSREVAERNPWAKHLTVWDVQSNTMQYVLDPERTVAMPVKPTPSGPSPTAQPSVPRASKPGTAPQPAMAHLLAILATSMSPKGNVLVTAGADAILKLWDPVQGTLLRQLATPTITALAFSHDGTLLAAGTDQGQIRIWETDQWREYPPYSSRQGRINALVFGKTSNVLVIVGSAPRVLVVDIMSQELLRELIHTSDVHIGDGRGNTRVERSKEGDFVMSAAVDPTDNLLVTKSRTGIVYWDLATLLEVPPPADIPKSTTDLVQPGRWVTASHDSFDPNEFTLGIWDRRSKTRIAELDRFRNSDTEAQSSAGMRTYLGTQVVTDSDGKWAAVTVGEKVSIWDLAGKQKKATFYVRTPLWLRWTADGTHLVIRTEDRKILVWSAKTLQPLHYLKEPSLNAG